MTLRRHISILLAVLILGSNIGLAFNVHYCGDDLAAVSLAYNLEEPSNDHHKKDHRHEGEEKACCSIKAGEHESCCKNDLVKLEDNGESKVIVKSLQLELGTLCTLTTWNPAHSFTANQILIKENPSFYCESNAPPLFKLYCRYILYA